MRLLLRLAIAILAATAVAACGAQPTPVVPTATPTVPAGLGAVLGTALAPTATPMAEPEFQRIEGDYAAWEALAEKDYQSLLTMSAFTVTRPQSASLMIRCFADAQEAEIEVLWIGVAATENHHDEVKYGFGDFPSAGTPLPLSPVTYERWEFDSYQTEEGPAMIATFSPYPNTLMHQMSLWEWMSVALYDKDLDLLEGATFDLRGLPDALGVSGWGCG